MVSSGWRSVLNSEIDKQKVGIPGVFATGRFDPHWSVIPAVVARVIRSAEKISGQPIPLCSDNHRDKELCYAKSGVSSDSMDSPGSVKKKVEPFPTSDSTQIRPPYRSTIFRHVAKPIPVPG